MSELRRFKSLNDIISTIDLIKALPLAKADFVATSSRKHSQLGAFYRFSNHVLERAQAFSYSSDQFRSVMSPLGAVVIFHKVSLMTQIY